MQAHFNRWTVVAGAICILAMIAQFMLFMSHLTLSLGPFVIMQPWLLRQGYHLYSQTAEEHSPLLGLFLWAVFPLFPDALTMAKAVLVGIILLTTGLTAAVGYRAAGWRGALVGSLVFAVWSPLFYWKLWYDTLLGPLYLLIALVAPLTVAQYTPRRLMLLGLLAGLAIFAKQHAIVVALVLLIWLALSSWYAQRSWRKAIKVAAWTIVGMSTVLLLFVLLGVVTGSMGAAWDWIIGRHFRSHYLTLGAVYPTMWQWQYCAVMIAPLLMIMAGIFKRRELASKTQPLALLGALLLLAGAVTQLPRFAMFHFQPVLPIFAWLLALPFGALERSGVGTSERWYKSVLRSRLLPICAGIALLWLPFVAPSYALLWSNESQLVREYDELRPLALQVAPYLGPNDRLYIFPDDESNANLYYQLQRLPPPFWSVVYPWLLQPDMVARLQTTLAAHDPAVILLFPDQWGVHQYTAPLYAQIEAGYRLERTFTTPQGEVQLLRRRIIP